MGDHESSNEELPTSFLALNLKTLMGSDSVKRARQGGKCKARLQDQLAAYIPSVISLKECTTALEKHVLAVATFYKLDTEESEIISMSVYTFPLQWEIGVSGTSFLGKFMDSKLVSIDIGLDMNCSAYGMLHDDFLHAESSHLDGDQVATVSDGVSDLQDLQRRIKAIEKAMVEKERHFSANQVEKKFGDGVGNTEEA
ncbi:PREDICTED: NETWORKED 1D [Prunus dulcis]|uniref:PREDICTED: NETWORKED 1D n=1 Tax=Prunus dulcis TaxID=3755 RepID=A0A5E4EFA8_PRUDU|nr:PREDICTED: NETWORKED 1D [Prunus dulcis]